MLCNTISYEPAQLVAGVFISLFYWGLYGRLQPYMSSEDNLMADTSNAQICLTFLLILIIRTKMFESIPNMYKICDSVLVLVNLSVFILTLAYTTKPFWEPYLKSLTMAASNQLLFKAAWVNKLRI